MHYLIKIEAPLDELVATELKDTWVIIRKS